ncbi:MAG: HD domain-containing protein [Deinococcales bacterium]
MFRFLKHRCAQAKRVLIGFFPQWAKADDDFARSILSSAEFGLYLSMDIRDRDHACRVVRDLLEHPPKPSTELLRAALLHDVGKSDGKYRVWARILVHLYCPKNLPIYPKLKGLRGLWQQHVYHAEYGAAMIKGVGGSSRVAQIVQNHHHLSEDAEAMLLKAIDECY